MKKFITLPILSLAVAAVASAPATLDVKTAQSIANRVITPDQLKGFLTFIASDALQGRNTPSPGLDSAAEFLAYNLARWGAKPGGDNGTFFQKIKLTRSSIDASATSLTVGGNSFKQGVDLAITSGTGSVIAQGVYIAKEIGNTNVEGKVVILGEQADMSEMRKASEKGAVAVLSDIGDAGPVWESMIKPREKSFTMEGGDGKKAPLRGFILHKTLSKILPDLKDTDSVRPLTGTVSLDVVGKTEIAMTQNVVAIVEGSDPVLKKEYVALGAHYDHIGTRPGGSGDTIYNGADDDGSGTSGALGIAEAALSTAQRPKRSLLFVWHCGEEKGLWGSAYFSKNPTVPISSVVAQLNMDMIGRSRAVGDTKKINEDLTGGNAIYVIGTTMMSSRLGELVKSVNKSFLNLNYDAKYDSPDDPNRFFYRSDHYNYAKVGIPICFWFDGVHEDYHGLGDEVSKIDFNKMSKVSRTVFVTAVAVANEPTRPKVDKPLDR